MKHIIVYNISADSLHALLYKISADNIDIVGTTSKQFKVYELQNGGLENNPNEIFSCLCSVTEELLKKHKINKSNISAITFVSKARSFVLVDENGKLIRNAMDPFDRRAVKVMDDELHSGFKIHKININKYFRSKNIAGFIPTNPRDSIWKYNWVRIHEKENFSTVFKWLDIQGYLIYKCTNKFVMSEDHASYTGLFDTRINKLKFSKKLCKTYKVKYNHLPTVKHCNDIVGKLTSTAAEKIGLTTDVDVICGSTDVSAISIGSKCIERKDSFIYCGNSGLFCVNSKNRIGNYKKDMVSYKNANEEYYSYVSEMETAGKSLAWMFSIINETDVNKEIKNVFKQSDIGSSGLIFAPWLHGKATPINDTNVSGMFFGLNINTTKEEMIRAVIEGIYYQFRWMIESSYRNTETNKKIPIKFISAYADSKAYCQLVSDIIDRPIEIVEGFENVDSTGAAIIAARALKIFDSYRKGMNLIKVKDKYTPNKKNQVEYESNYQVFIRLHKANKENFANHVNKTINYRNKFMKFLDSLKFILFIAAAPILEVLIDFMLSKYVLGLQPWLSWLIASFVPVIWNFTINRNIILYGAPNKLKSGCLYIAYYIVVIPASVVFKSFLTDGVLFSIINLGYHCNLENTIASLITLLVTIILEFTYTRFVVFKKIRSTEFKIKK